MAEKKIVERMDEVHFRIYADPEGVGKVLAGNVQRRAFAAAFAGLGKPEWVEYMKCFASNKQQLDRLVGADEGFISVEWKKNSLAYLVGNSNCGVDTFTGTRRNMSPLMLKALDEGVSSEIDPEFAKFHESLEKIEAENLVPTY